MGNEYKEIKIPPDEQVIWRYMGFSSFVNLLESNSLHFTRVDQLDDPFEGSFPKININLRASIYKAKLPPSSVKLLSHLYKEYVEHTFVNCWHINKNQSAAMWKLYLPGDEGIAIKSKVGNLRSSFKTKKYDLVIGEINYISYTKDLIPEGPIFPYFCKRKSFEHERELRVIFQDYAHDSAGEMIWSKPTSKNGINIRVDIELLIDKIVVAPLCLPWQKKLVQKILDKYKLDINVSQSTLYTRDSRILY